MTYWLADIIQGNAFQRAPSFNITITIGCIMYSIGLANLVQLTVKKIGAYMYC